MIFKVLSKQNNRVYNVYAANRTVPYPGLSKTITYFLIYENSNWTWVLADDFIPIESTNILDNSSETTNTFAPHIKEL